MSLTIAQHRPVQPVPDGDGWFCTVDLTEETEQWRCNACVADRGQEPPTFEEIVADLRALAGDDYMRGIEEVREHEEPSLDTLTHPTVWVLRRGQWNVTFAGPLSDDARGALDRGTILLVSGHRTVAGESHSVRVEAIGAHDAISRVRTALQGHGHFGRWHSDPVRDEHRL